MKKSQIEIGRVYAAKVSGRISPVRIVSESPHGGWRAVNMMTGREVHVRSPQRLRFELRKKNERPEENHTGNQRPVHEA
jgi:hypothetical protein